MRSAFNKSIDACGIHRSSEEMDQTQKDSLHVTLRLWKGAEIPFHDHSFDYVFEVDSFECFSNFNVGLNEIQRVLNKDGIFMAVVPNKDVLLSSKYPLSDKTAASKGYLERSLDEWKNLFRQAGFTITDTKKR